MKKYPSKYSNGKTISAAQYIAEIVCERIAKRTKRDLHYRFWLSAEWEKEYKGQIAAANKLLKAYDPKRIIDALSSLYGQKIYSLRAPHLKDIIDKTPIVAEINNKVPNRIIERNLLDKGKVTIKPKNILDKLKDIDNDSNSR